MTAEMILPRPARGLGSARLAVAVMICWLVGCSGGDNSNTSLETFYEGAMVAGCPTNDVELSIMKNVKAVGYSR